MRRILLIFCELLLAASAHAKSLQVKERHFRMVPGAHRLVIGFDEGNFDVPRISLPKPVYAVVNRSKISTLLPNGKVDPSQISGFTYDLNGDGQTEYFIRDNRAWDAYTAFGKLKGRWQRIGFFSGSLYAVPSHHGWVQIVQVSSGYDQTTGRGRHDWVKTYSEFKGSEYVNQTEERLKQGKIIKQRPFIYPIPYPDEA